MKSRLAASLAISALVIVGATGCSMMAPQATTIDYSASDGANIPKSGPIEVRNAFVVVDKKGTTGNLVAGLVNVTSSDATIHITVGDGAAQSVRVPAHGAVSLGGDEQEPLRFEDLDAKPGSTVQTYFQSGDAEGVKFAIPVLDGTLPYYSKLVPSATPEPTMKPLPATSPSPTSTPAS